MTASARVLPQQDRPSVAPAAGTRTLARVIRIELAHAARLVLLWVGVAASLVVVMRGLGGLWPSVSGDAIPVWHSANLLSPFALLAGGWLGVRDRRTGASELIRSTPTPTSRIRVARLAAIGSAAALAFAALFAAGILTSVIRGGHGGFDPRLVLDGMLGAAAGAAVGFALGTLTGSVVLCLFAAPLYAFGAFNLSYFATEISFRASIQWLSPTPIPPEHSAVLGFLPDIFRLHPVFLAGVVLILGGLLAALAREGRPMRRLLGPGTAAAVAGAVVVSVAASALLAKPDGYIPTGPNPATWSPQYHGSNDLMAGQPFTYPNDHLATACASGGPLTVCVYPAYGRALAERVLTELRPQAELLRGLPGAPALVRMIPVDPGSCRSTDGAVVFPEPDISFSPDLVSCLLDGRTPLRGYTSQPAQQAVELWAMLRLGLVTEGEARSALEQTNLGTDCPQVIPAPPSGGPAGACFPVVSMGQAGDWRPEAVRAALAMEPLSIDRVREDLSRVWSELVAGTLPLSELPGQSP